LRAHKHFFRFVEKSVIEGYKSIFIFASFLFFRGKNPLDGALKLLHADNLDTPGKTFM